MIEVCLNFVCQKNQMKKKDLEVRASKFKHVIRSKRKMLMPNQSKDLISMLSKDLITKINL